RRGAGPGGGLAGALDPGRPLLPPRPRRATAAAARPDPVPTAPAPRHPAGTVRRRAHRHAPGDVAEAARVPGGGGGVYRLPAHATEPAAAGLLSGRRGDHGRRARVRTARVGLVGHAEAGRPATAPAGPGRSSEWPDRTVDVAPPHYAGAAAGR